MQEAELRSNNWVLDEGKPFQIRGGYDIAHAQNYEPIVLTHEVLEKCGLKKLPEEMFETPFQDRFIKLWSVGGGESQYQLCVNERYLPSMLRYLHQYQNLYYSITGEELKIDF